MKVTIVYNKLARQKISCFSAISRIVVLIYCYYSCYHYNLYHYHYYHYYCFIIVIIIIIIIINVIHFILFHFIFLLILLSFLFACRVWRLCAPQFFFFLYNDLDFIFGLLIQASFISLSFISSSSSLSFYFYQLY